MGAYVDHTEGGPFPFGWRKVSPKSPGATGIPAGGWTLIGHMLDDYKKTWSVCPHLSTLESLFDYYMASGSIMVLLGKCFCHACYKMVLARQDLKEFMDSCQHMTDKRFQKDFIDRLVQINRQVFKARRNFAGAEKSRWSWVGCSHVVKAEQLAGLYTSCNSIFFQEGVLACGGGPQNLDSVLSSDSDPKGRIRNEQETQKAQCPIQG